MTCRALAGTAALLAVAGCAQEQANVAAPDIGNAASEAQADINSYAAATVTTDGRAPKKPPSVRGVPVARP